LKSLAFLILIGVVSYAFPLFAQTSSLTVTGLDDAEGIPLPEASVAVAGPTPQNAPVKNGRANLTGIADGVYTITVDAEGYESKSGKISISSADKAEYSGLFRLRKTSGSPVKKEFKAESKPKEQTVPAVKTPPPEKPKEAAKPAITPQATKEEKKADDRKQTAAKEKPAATPEPEPGPQTTAEKKPFLEGLKAPSWKTALIITSVAACFFSLIIFVAALVRWKKSGKGGKIILLSGTLGCGCLTLIIVAVMLAVVFFQVRRAPSEGDKTLPEYKEPAVNPETMSRSSYSAASAALIESFNDPKNADKRSSAIALLAQAAEENPGDDTYAVDLADTYVICSDPYAVRIAADIYEDVLSRRPGDEAILARAADAYIQLDEFDKAYAFIKRRIALPKSDLYAASLQIALICGETNNFDTGISRLNEILTRHPGSLDVRLLLAAMQIQNGLTEIAKSNLDEVITKLPQGSPLAVQAVKMRKGLGK